METVRYYAREQKRMVDRIFYSEFSISPYRATFPLLGTEAQPRVISEEIPITVGDSDPTTRDLEALGVTASSYELIQPRFEKFEAYSNATYKLRLMAQNFTAEAIIEKNGSIQPSRERTIPGLRDEPVSLYAVAGRSQRKLGEFDVTPEAQVNQIEVLLRKGETIGPDASRLFRSRPPGPIRNPLATPEGVPEVAFRWLEVEGPIIAKWPPAEHSENPEKDLHELLETFSFQGIPPPCRDF